ncbi:MAG: hypothetical protein GX159_03770 [Flavobacteriaceae bacterium]|jgi:hypothetical protein|nr:hypothetical protein [Flavobacteriaceae bacterium]
MKVNFHVKVIVSCVIGFLLVGYIIFSSQNKRFVYLKENGWYTIAIGKEIEKRRTGWAFKYNYKVSNMTYEGVINFNLGDSGMTVGGIYFVMFDPKNHDKKMLIKYPAVPAEINLDSIPAEGWEELPVSVPKDSIKNFLD